MSKKSSNFAASFRLNRCLYCSGMASK